MFENSADGYAGEPPGAIVGVRSGVRHSRDGAGLREHAAFLVPGVARGAAGIGEAGQPRERI
jgi:hypothetical protein